MEHEPCELFKLIPHEKIDSVFRKSKTAGAEMDYEFLGFEDVYKAVTLFVQKSKIIIDFGCSYAFQSWYFRDYKKYIGVDAWTDAFLETENSRFFSMKIQDFIREVFPVLGCEKEEVFAVCSYVPDREARRMVRESFPYCLVYYPK